MTIIKIISEILLWIISAFLACLLIFFLTWLFENIVKLINYISKTIKEKNKQKIKRMFNYGNMLAGLILISWLVKMFLEYILK
ncbi:hypothetical protein KAI04_04065 [Candidatus Pacearchaeota archaeon]|nr:hypothetical protein [Candidatus Pacearchaeota archaeon]